MFRRTSIIFFGALLILLELVLGPPGFDRGITQAHGADQVLADSGAQVPRTLTREAPINGKMRAGETLLFTITAPAPNQLLHLVIAQASIDIGAVLRAQDGQALASTTPGSTLRQKSILVRINSAGTYHLELRPLNGSAIGCYEVRIERLQPFAQSDGDRIAAYSAFEAGERSKAKLKQSALEQAAKDYNRALGLWQQPDDRLEIVRTLNSLGDVYVYLTEHDKAMKAYERSLSLSRPAGYVWEEAAALNGLGALYVIQNKIEQGIGHLSDKALPLWLKSDNKSGALETLANLIYIYSAMRRTDEAERYSKQAMALVEEPCGRYDKAALLNNIGKLHYDQGEYIKAAEYYLPAQEIFHEIGADVMEAGVLNNLGTCYYSIGEHQKALNYYNLARPLLEESSDRPTQGTLLNNIGTLYSSLGDDRMALNFFKQALPFWETPRQPRGLAQTLEHIGNTYSLLKRPHLALSYLRRARALFREAKEPGSEAYTLARMAAVHFSLGRSQLALSYLKLARPLAEGRDPQAAAYISLNLGKVYAALRRGDSADGEYQRGLAIARKSKDVHEQATFLHELALVERSRGNLKTAHPYLREAMKLIESIRTNVISHSLRASFLASKQDIYNAEIEVLMEWHDREPSAGHDVEALNTSERSRARSLLDLLSEAQADLSQGIKPELLESRRRLQQEITARTTLRSELMQNEPATAQIGQLDRKIDDLIYNLSALEDRIRSESPRYAALALPQPLTCEEIQAKVLDPDTSLLEYQLGAKRSYLWVVTKDRVQSYILPQRDVIEGLARKTYRALTERMYTEPAETYLKRVSRQDTAFYVHARELSRMLFGPAAAELRRKRLLIVRDGALEYIPFAALPVPDLMASSGSELLSLGACQGSSYCPAVVAYEIVSASSASTLHILREDTKRRPTPLKTIAVFAQPVFAPLGKEAAKISRTPQSSRLLIPDITKSLNQVRSIRQRQILDPLPYTGREADLIETLVPRDKRYIARRFEVNHDTATSSALGDYRFVHFATHSLIDNQRPELSGIFLSLWDEQGRFQHNGILRLGEIYDLELSADAVILSACETALGQQLNGEGFIGLTRGFMYAGASCVVASLWLVSDKSTADLMGMFYEGLLSKEQMPATSALRTAQARFWQQAKGTEKSFPYFWAAFIAQGLYSKEGI